MKKELVQILAAQLYVPSEQAILLSSRISPKSAVITVAIAALLLYSILLLLASKKKSRDREWQKANIDPLTGIGNLNLFQNQAGELLCKNKDLEYAVLRFDIKNFKLLNEIYGFERGDWIIQNLANVVGAMVIPDSDACARIGGDNFILLKSYTRPEEIDFFPEKCEDHIHRAVGNEFDSLIKLKYGIYHIKDRKEPVSSILEKANYAHSICKVSLNTTRFIYDEIVKQNAIEEKRIEARMEEALIKQQFMLYLQPKYRLSDETLAGAEALVRWRPDDSGDLIYPNSFIPLFEKNGFITKLDIYMLERVCELISSWIDQNLTPVTVSINFSRLHLLNPGFIKNICAVTNRYDIPRKYIEIELTESTMFNNEEVMFSVLEGLHEEGFTISMDDFGTGYSSLGLLKNLPVDVLKIDRSFFTDSRFKTRAKAVIENVIQMAKRLEIHTVAEGIETQDQIDMLREMGCEIVQGYYYSKPVPAAEFQLTGNISFDHNVPKELQIDLKDLGNLELGRASMGEVTSVYSYRLFQVSLRQMLRSMYGDGETAYILNGTGKLAGSLFAKSELDLSLPFDDFLVSLMEKLAELKIAHLAVERFDMETGSGVITLLEDLDCSGMSDSHETLCQYDEGFLAGILKEYTRKSYSVIEVDCWGTGCDRCRFEIKPK